MEQFDALTDEEKAQSVRSSIKSLQYSKYNLELSLEVENSISNPNQSVIEEYQLQLDVVTERENVLLSILEQLVPPVLPPE